MQIRVLLVDGRSHLVDSFDGSVCAIRKRIAEVLEVHEQRIRVFYQGKEWVDAMGQVDVADGAVVHVHVRPMEDNGGNDKEQPLVGQDDLELDVLVRQARMIMFAAIVDGVRWN